MKNPLKSIRAEDLPALALRGTALFLIAVHLFIAIFIVNHYRWVFYLTAAVIGMLLAREMYEDLALRFFRLKAEKYEHDLEEVAERTKGARTEAGMLIEGNASRRARSEDATDATLVNDAGERSAREEDAQAGKDRP